MSNSVHPHIVLLEGYYYVNLPNNINAFQLKYYIDQNTLNFVYEKIKMWKKC